MATGAAYDATVTTSGLTTLQVGSVEIADVTKTLALGAVQIKDAVSGDPVLSIGAVEVRDKPPIVVDTGLWMRLEGVPRPVTGLWIRVPD